ncbi:MAG: 4Fe-4S binding protein [Polyangia bacterium]|jgi:Fe-S-cluster-containing hydrogenase component 2
MKRKIIQIDESRCDGCGHCIDACHEEALAIVGGKALLVRDTFCDGLGACIGKCPQDALTIVEREAEDFDMTAIEAAPRRTPAPHGGAQVHRSCPGSAMRSLQPAPMVAAGSPAQPPPSSLSHWPVQLMLVPPHAPFLEGASLVVCADCVPFAVPDFHARYLAGKAVVIGCPKLDDLPHYAEKLAAIMRHARPRSLTVLRMEVPCCRGISQAAIGAALGSEQRFPIEEHVVGVRGGIERIVVRSIEPAAPVNEEIPG